MHRQGTPHARPILARLLLLLSLIVISMPTKANSWLFDADQQNEIKTYLDYKREGIKPCEDEGPWMQARREGRIAYGDRHLKDVRLTLIENKPELVEKYGECMEAMKLLDALVGLMNPSVYIDTIALSLIGDLIYKEVVDAVCAEIEEQAEEVFGEIADLIPSGNYVYHLDDVFTFEVQF